MHLKFYLPLGKCRSALRLPWSPGHPWTIRAAALAAAIGATVLGAAAQVISDPNGWIAVGTEGESTQATYLAVSNGGDATTTCWETFGLPCSGTASWGGNATGGVAVSVFGGAVGTEAATVGGFEAYGYTFEAAIDPLGDAYAPCGGFMSVAVALGSASACGNPSIAIGGAAAGSEGGMGGALGPSGATSECQDPGVAIALSGSASSNCGGIVWGASGTAAVSGSGSARSDEVAVSGEGPATGGLVAISGTGNATGGWVAVTGTGQAYACGGPVNVAESVSANANLGGWANSCAGTAPVAQTTGTSVTTTAGQ